MANRNHISHGRLREVLNYDPLSGEFYWRITLSSRRLAGALAGSVNKHHGYIEIGIDGVVYRAHRLAYFYMTKEWPEECVDHIDLIRSNNKWTNIRKATRSQNQKNTRVRGDSKSGLKGAFLRSSGTYSSKIKVGGKVFCLGTFNTPEEAHAAYCEAAHKYNGEIARTG